MINKLLCFIGLHAFEDVVLYRIHIYSLCFTDDHHGKVSRCKHCGKIKNNP